MHYIPYSRQNINQADIDAVVSVLRSDFVTQGPEIAKFEDVIKEYSGAKYAIAVASGTAGLHLALLALDVSVGDIVWTCPISFVASANCALYVGAKIDFVDCEPGVGNIDLNSLKIKLEQAKISGCLPKAIVIVHFSGRVCAMQEINVLAKQYGFKIIEDAAHALGASYPGDRYRKVGCNDYADITMFSFHPVKSITTGEGGVLTTNDKIIADKISLLRSHGISRDNEKMLNTPHGPWYYEQIELGLHYRMTDMQAALGTSQMGRLEEFISKRCSIAEYYNKRLATLPISLPQQDSHSAWHLYVIHVESGLRKKVFEHMRSANIGVNVHYIPIHLQPYYQNLGFKPGDFPNSEKFYAGAISLPIFPELTSAEMEYIIDNLKSIL